MLNIVMLSLSLIGLDVLISNVSMVGAEKPKNRETTPASSPSMSPFVHVGNAFPASPASTVSGVPLSSLPPSAALQPVSAAPNASSLRDNLRVIIPSPSPVTLASLGAPTSPRSQPITTPFFEVGQVSRSESSSPYQSPFSTLSTDAHVSTNDADVLSRPRPTTGTFQFNEPALGQSNTNTVSSDHVRPVETVSPPDGTRLFTPAHSFTPTKSSTHESAATVTGFAASEPTAECQVSPSPVAAEYGADSAVNSFLREHDVIKIINSQIYYINKNKSDFDQHIKTVNYPTEVNNYSFEFEAFNSNREKVWVSGVGVGHTFLATQKRWYVYRHLLLASIATAALAVGTLKKNSSKIALILAMGTALGLIGFNWYRYNTAGYNNIKPWYKKTYGVEKETDEKLFGAVDAHQYDYYITKIASTPYYFSRQTVQEQVQRLLV